MHDFALPVSMAQKYVADSKDNRADFSEAYMDLLEEYCDNHHCLADTFDITEQEMEASYQIALQAYQEGHYHLASRAFSLLLLLRPDMGPLHLALASVQQQLGEYSMALKLFLSATRLMPNDPSVLFRIAECQVSLSKYDVARDVLRQCLSLCMAQNTHPNLYQNAATLMDKLH